MIFCLLMLLCSCFLSPNHLAVKQKRSKGMEDLQFSVRFNHSIRRQNFMSLDIMLQEAELAKALKA